MRDNVTTGLAHQRYQRRATSVPHPNCAQLAHLQDHNKIREVGEGGLRASNRCAMGMPLPPSLPFSPFPLSLPCFLALPAFSSPSSPSFPLSILFSCSCATCSLCGCSGDERSEILVPRSLPDYASKPVSTLHISVGATHLREKLAPLQPLQVQPVVLPRHPPRALRRDRRAFCGRVERLTPAPEQFRHMPILVACRRLMRGEQVWGISWIIFRNEAEAVERAEGGQPSADRRAAGLLDVVEEDHEATGQPWRGARHAAVARQAAAAA
eukprot:scaffold178914_cov35-Tisochrysis_lutea.AAC.1